MKNIALEHRRGFTLIELLVVVAIMGVIATVVVLNVGGFFVGRGEISETARYTIYVVEEGVQKNIGTTIFGDVLIRYPKRMDIGDSKEVSLTLTPPDATVYESDVIEESMDAGTYYVVSDDVQVYSVMYAELHAVNFEISSTSTQYKEVSPTSRTDWVWIIAPDTDGRQLLRVELSTPVRVQGYEGTVPRAVYSRQMQIWVRKPFDLQRFLGTWQAILGIIGGIAGIFLLSRRIKRHQKAQGAKK